MKTKILVRAPALSQSGYGEQARFALRALKTREDIFDIYLVNINWGNTSWIFHDDEERRWLDHISHKTLEHQRQKGRYDISLQITIPNEFVQLAPKNIGYTAGIETTLVAPEWIDKGNKMDHIIVVSNHSKETFERTRITAVDQEGNLIQENIGVTTPITVVNFPVKEYEPNLKGVEFLTNFNFVTVAQWGPRKNLNRTIKWFIEEFIDQEDVGLIVKANTSKNCIMDREVTYKRMKAVLKKYPQRKCKIYLLHGHMSNEEMTGLYQHPQIKAYISLTHGEGFGLPIFEAAYNGLPVIAPVWSGQNDYLYMPVENKKGKIKQKAMCAKIDYNIQQVPKEAVWKGVLDENSSWCYPEQGSYKMRLREVFKDHSRFKSQSKTLQTWIKENFSAELKYKEFTDCIIETCNTEVKSVQEVVVL